MKVDKIQNGVVIDHIKAGSGLKLYELLELDTKSYPVAIINNVESKRMGKKDIIKIDADITINLDVIGFVDPDATVNIIKDGENVQKYSCKLPEKLTNVIKCKNPRCISCCEQELDQIFVLTDRNNRTYRCIYCETEAATLG